MSKLKTLEIIDSSVALNMATSANDIETTLEKSALHHVEHALGVGAVVEAMRATDEEHEQTLWQAIRANRKAVAWSVLISMSVIMEGYDTILMGNFFAFPTFVQKYGQFYGGSIGWQVSAPWQMGLNMASTVGCIFGELRMLCVGCGYDGRLVR